MGNKVSICIPAYNNILFLGKCLQSILDQTYSNYEVIITDDSDNTDVKELVNQYNFNGRLFYYRNSKALGSPQNWNYCISKATGDYIKILHHDDWFNLNTSLEKLVQLLESDDNSFAFCGCRNVTVADAVLFYHSITPNEALTIKHNPEFLFFNNRIGAPSVVIFKNTAIKFDENIKYTVDLEFYIALLNNNNKFAYTTEALINIGHSESQVTHTIINNKKLLIYEYSYTFQKLRYTNKGIKWYFDTFWNIIGLLDNLIFEDLEVLGWQGEIPVFVRNILASKRFIRRARLYKMDKLIKLIVYNYSKLNYQQL